MIKSELIQRVAAANPHLFQRDVERIINIVLDEITGALARGDRVELREPQAVLLQLLVLGVDHT